MGDLTDEEREELLGGLEADLSERLAEGEAEPGAGLGDPEEYAAELRTAAGLDVRSGHGRRARVGLPRLDTLLDDARTRWDRVVQHSRLRGPWDFARSVRPLWWFMRAWVAVQLLDLVVGPGGRATVLPTLMGVLPGVVVTCAAVVASVQIGRGRWWPGSRVARSLPLRYLLLGLNCFALLMLPVVLGQFPGSGSYVDDQAYYVPPAGVQDGGSYVTNVFPYDVHGNPLTGVQLFDQNGDPLTVARDARNQFGDVRLTTSYPWFNGDRRLWNVFPLPGRTTRVGDGPLPRVSDRAWTSTNPPVLPTPPLAVVPPAVLPTPSASPSSESSAPPSGQASPTRRPSTTPTAPADSEKPSPR